MTKRELGFALIELDEMNVINDDINVWRAIDDYCYLMDINRELYKKLMDMDANNEYSSVYYALLGIRNIIIDATKLNV